MIVLGIETSCDDTAAALLDSEASILANVVSSQDLIHQSPLLAYLAPGRFAAIERSNAFPFPAEMKK